MERTGFSSHRMLLVGPKTHPMHLLRSVMAIAGINKVAQVMESQQALDLLSIERFSAVFCDRNIDAPDEMPFLVAARRSASILDPMIPIFLLKDRASRRDVETARDTGATDVLTVPISPRTLIAKLETAMKAPRPFIVSPEFFGPDRRARLRPAYFGSDRRTRIPKKVKVDLTQV